MASSKVRNMISIYENYAFNKVDSEPEKLSKKRTKSMSSVNPFLRRSQERAQEQKPKSEINLELAQIEQQVQHLNNNLNNYKIYSRENHIFYQNEIFFLLTDIINVDARDDPYIISKKSELIELLKRLNTGLNSRLPSANQSYKDQSFDQKVEKVHHQKTEHKKTEKFTTQKKYQVEVPSLKSPKKADEGHVVIKRQETVDQEDETDAPAPSVKTLKQLWEKNISQNEKTKEKESQDIKVSQVFLKLNGTSSTKYVPFSEKVKFNSFDSSYLNSEIVDMYENSVHSKGFYSLEGDDEEKPESLSQDSRSSDQSDGNSDDGVDGQNNEDVKRSQDS